MNRKRTGIALVGLVFLAACGGTGGGGSSSPEPGGARLESGHGRPVLDEEGGVQSLLLLASGTELAVPDSGAILEVDSGGETFLPTSLRRKGDEIVARFDALDGQVRIGVEEASGHVIFRVHDVAPADAEALRLRIPVRILSTSDSPLNGTFDEDSAVCLRPLTASTHASFSAASGVLTLSVEWVRRHGLVGGAAALVATPRDSLLDAIEALEAAEGLPSPHFGGVRARESEAVRESYLFLTYYAPGDLEELIDYAKVGGFRLILFLRGLWRESSGTYGIDTTKFPGGLDEFADVCEQIHAAGLGVGVHIFGPSISADDPLVTPVPDDRLLAWPCPSLAEAVDGSATELVLTDAPDLPAPTGGKFPGKFLRLGNELVRYSEAAAGPPFRFTGCERGALGTVAGAHLAGATVRHLATTWDMFLIDPDSTLVAEVAANLGRVVNTAGVDMVYFDGTAQIPTGEHVDRWYYMNRLLPAYHDAFDHPVLVQTGMGPGRQLAWHVVPRSASADGHGDIKWFLDRRTPSIESIRRGLTAPDVGWYGFDEGRPPDHLEYIAAKCLGWDCSLSVQSYRIALEKDARARETLEMLGRYEQCKRDGALPMELREELLTTGADFRLLTDGDDWHLYRAVYEREEPVSDLEGGDHHAWTVTNPDASESLVGVEIVRGGAIRVDAPYDDPGRIPLDEFEAVDAYATGGENDFSRLVNRTDPILSAQGVARRGVEFALEVAEDPRVGSGCAALTARNTGTGIGWCAVGRRFSSPVDVSAGEALGLWIRGDGSATTLRIELWDDEGHRAQVRAPIHFEGWRLQTFALNPPKAFDPARVRYVIFILSDLPPERDVEIRLDGLRALPTVHPAADLPGVRLRIGGRLLELPAALPPGATARIDALGRLTIWPGGMAAGQTWSIPGGSIRLLPGTHEVRFELADPAGHARDVAIRLSRLTSIAPP